MRAFVRSLSAPKSDNGDLRNQDAHAGNPKKGLFAIADGAGTTIFADVWSRTLVKRFIESEPLLSADRYEVRWWLPGARADFEAEVPALDAPDQWNARNKLKLEGSQATFLGLRCIDVTDDSVTARIVAFGDCCAFVVRADESVETFPAGRLADLDAPPVCLPSSQRVFSHRFHHGYDHQFPAASGDRILLATDAVARFIFRTGETTSAGVAAVIAQIENTREDQWSDYVTARRAAGDLDDDDSTVLLVVLSSGDDGEELGRTSSISAEARDRRQMEYRKAYEEKLSLQMATLWGDGTALSEAADEEPDNLGHCREVGDAIDAIETILKRSAYGSPVQRAELTRVWQESGSLIRGDRSAEGVLGILSRLDVDVNVAGQTETGMSDVAAEAS